MAGPIKAGRSRVRLPGGGEPGGVDLIHAGKLDEAERAAQDLLERFPDVHDGWGRLGMVYEARGDNKKAAESYRKVIDFIRAHPDQYDEGFDEVFVKLVEKLDPAAH